MSDDNVIEFPNGSVKIEMTEDEVAPSAVLNSAAEIADEFEQVLVLGWRKNGLLYVASSEGYMPDNLALLECVKSEYLLLMMGRD